MLLKERLVAGKGFYGSRAEPRLKIFDPVYDKCDESLALNLLYGREP